MPPDEPKYTAQPADIDPEVIKKWWAERRQEAPVGLPFGEHWYDAEWLKQVKASLRASGWYDFIEMCEAFDVDPSVMSHAWHCICRIRDATKDGDMESFSLIWMLDDIELTIVSAMTGCYFTTRTEGGRRFMVATFPKEKSDA